jgi:hypothetical protein
MPVRIGAHGSASCNKVGKASVADPDEFLLPPGFGSGSIRFRTADRSGAGSCSSSGSGSLYRQVKIVRKTLIPTVL